MTGRFPAKQLTKAFAMLVALEMSIIHAQDPLQILPRNYHLIFDNPFVRVLNVKYAAHEKLPLHNHSDKPTIYVYLTDSGPVRFSHIEEHPFSLVRPPEKAGTFRVSPGRLEKHSVENLGDVSTEFLRVELKQVPLGFQGNSFRGKRAFDTSQSSVSTEYSDSYVTIERLIAADGKTADGHRMGDPSLIIALGATRVRLDATAPVLLQRGEVFWLGPNTSYHLRGADEKTSGHLLQIAFKRNGK